MTPPPRASQVADRLLDVVVMGLRRQLVGAIRDRVWWFNLRWWERVRKLSQRQVDHLAGPEL